LVPEASLSKNFVKIARYSAIFLFPFLKKRIQKLDSTRNILPSSELRVWIWGTEKGSKVSIS